MEAGKKRLSGDTMREANTSEVKELKDENRSLKELVAELSLDNRDLKKNLNGKIKTEEIHALQSKREIRNYSFS